MDKIRRILTFAKYNMQKSYSSLWAYLRYLCFGLVIFWYVIPLLSVLKEQELRMNVFELYVMLSNSCNAIRFIFFGFLLVIFEFPFLEEGIVPYLGRSSRWEWCVGQVIYIIGDLIIYNMVFILVCGLCLNLYGTWNNQWSEFFIWLQRQFDYPAEVEFSMIKVMQLLNYRTLWKAALMNFSWNILWMLAIACLYMALVLVGRKMALGIMGIIFLMDVGVRQSILGDKLFLVSPLTWARWLSYKEVIYNFPLIWGVCGFSAIIACSVFLLIRLLPEYDFEFSVRDD